MQNFSIELSKKLSELVPDIGEHAYDWVVQEGNNGIGCTEHLHRQIICPAWQAEDVLRNLLRNLMKLPKMTVSKFNVVREIIASDFVFNPDTAYQKIEEYLWTILK